MVDSDFGDDGLRAAYLAYLDCLNERQWQSLGEYVAAELSYNGQSMTLADYRAMLEADVEAIPDLQFHSELLVADGDVVACRIFFRCTPQHTFLGFEPTGAQVSFAEHVFYRFENGRIIDVWSLIDKEAIRRQVELRD